jgi:hypothetical protein
MDLSSSTKAALTFWQFYDIEDGKDFGYVEASADGEQWTILDTFTGRQSLPMKKRCTLLDGFCGPGNEAVHIRFRLVSDGSGTADGWSIDEIMTWYQIEVGDVNCDGVLNILDVIGTVNVILGQDSSPYAVWAADMNEDGRVNIIDAIVQVNHILSNPKEHGSIDPMSVPTEAYPSPQRD